MMIDNSLLPSTWPVPANYSRTCWAELSNRDIVYLLCLKVPNPVTGKIDETWACGPYVVLDPETRKLQGRCGEVVQETGDSRLLKKAEAGT